jgi:glycosyltransferase involved in cell wall biosynthesis
VRTPSRRTLHHFESRRSATERLESLRPVQVASAATLDACHRPGRMTTARCETTESGSRSVDPDGARPDVGRASSTRPESVKRVLVVNDFADGGGAEVVANETAAALRARGVEVLLATADSLNVKRRPWSYVYNARALRRLRDLVAEFQPDVVHLHNFYHVLSPAVLGAISPPAKLVVTLHDYHLVAPNVGLEHFRRTTRTPIEVSELPLRVSALVTRRWDARGWPHSALRALQHLVAYRLLRLQRHPHLYLSPSATAAAILRRSGIEADVLANATFGLDMSPWAERSASGPLRIVVAGRIEPEKGIDRFLEMLAGVQIDFTVDVVGEGAAIDACRRAAAKLSGNVKFHGRTTRDDAVRIMQSGHVLALPSVWYETDPLVLIEGLSQGCWLLCSARGGGVDTVNGSGAGLTYDTESPEELARALEELAVKARDLPDRERVTSYLATRSPAAHIDRLLDLYGRVVAVQ